MIPAKPAGKSRLPNWYNKYRNVPGVLYLNIAVILILTSAVGLGIYNQFFKTAQKPLAYPTTLKTPNRYLSFQGRLTNQYGNPVTDVTSVVFTLYDDPSAGTTLWTGTCDVSPDTDGVFSKLLGSDCGAMLTSNIFSENAAVWLGVKVSTDAEATPRVQIATVAYALNSETLQGYPASASATINTVPVVNNSGQIVIAASSPKIQSTSGTFAIEGQALTISTPTASNGNITISPDGTGSAQFVFSGASPGSGTGMLSATDANLTSGALYYGSVNSNASGYNLLQLQSGSSPTDKFVVTSAGNVTAAGTVNGLTISSGTISSGTWNGTAIGTQWGGTGANNSSAAQWSVPYYTATGVMGGALAPTTAGYVLSTNDTGGAPSWIAMTSTGTNHWQLGSNILAPINVTNDLAIGGNSTASAKFQVFGTTGSASMSGTLTTGYGQTIRSAYGPLTLSYKSAADAWTTGITLADLTGNVTLASDLTVSGNDIYSAGSGTGTIFNTGVTTLSIGGAATILNLGTTDSVTRAINIGTGTGVDTIHIGDNVTGADVITIGSSGAGNVTVQSNAALTLHGEASSVIDFPNFDVDTSGNIISAGTASISGSLTFRTSGTPTIQTTAFNPLTIGGSTTGNITLSPSNNTGDVLPGADNAIDLGINGTAWKDIWATTIYQGVNQVCDAGGGVSGCGGVNYWGQALGALYPVNNTVDLLIGSSATSSAKFAFIGVNTGGTPTASISGATNIATFIDGNGNISSTNRNNLTLGNSATYNTTGNVLLNPNGTGFVGIGYTSPASSLDVAGGAVASLETNQVTNGTFDADTNWTKGTDWTIGSGVATKIAGTASDLSQDTGEAGSKMYYISFTLTRTAGTLQVAIGGVTYGEIFQTNGSKTAYVYSSGIGDLTFMADSSFAGTIDDANVQEVTSSLANSTFRDSAGTLRSELRLAGTSNTFFGRGSGKYNVSGGSYNTAFGTDALTKLTSGDNNTAIGEFTLYYNTTGYNNTAVGENSLYNNTTGHDNIAVGLEALAANTSSDENIAIGTSALSSVTGNDVLGNTIIGYWASENNTSGYYNTALGSYALGFTTTSSISNNVAIGYGALSGLNGSNNNIGIGFNAGNALTTGNTNIVIGYDIDLPAVTSSNMLDIGNLIYATGLTSTGTTVSTGNVGIGTTEPGSALQVGIGTETHALSTGDVLITSDLELDGILYLDGSQIANSVGTASILLSSTATTSANILSASNWLIENTANVGQAALMVNQTKGGDLFTASTSGTPEFTIHRDSSFTMAGTSTAPTAFTDPGTVYFNTTTKASNGTTTGDLFIRGEDAAWHRVALDMTQYSTTSAAVSSGSYLTLAHSQNTNDLTATGWVYDTISSLWKNISEYSHNIIQNLSNQWNTALSSGIIRSTVKLTDVELSQSTNTGTGADGTITVTGNTSINATSLIAGRSCADGGDAVNYSVTALTSTTATISSTPSAGCLAVGDEVLLINLQSASVSTTVNLGNYETLRIQNITSSTITFTTAKTKYYGDGQADDTNIGTAAATQKVMLQRVPNYINVTVNSSMNFYPTAWNGTKGGVMFFRATGTVTANGNIHANASGYTGGASNALAGEAFCGNGGGTGGYQVNTGNAGSNGICGGGGGAQGGQFGCGARSGGTGSSTGGAGGGGGAPVTVNSTPGGGGGGGGHFTAGAYGYGNVNGTSGGTGISGNGGSTSGCNVAGGAGGGGTYADTALNDMLFGSGGGAGGILNNGGTAGPGGAGGGVVMIAANSISVNGGINSNGGTGGTSSTANNGCGGGGAGGSVKLSANTLVLGTNLVTAASGSGGTATCTRDGGNGGTGGTLILYTDSYTGSSDNPTPTYTSQPYYPYGLYHSPVINTPNAAVLDQLRWESDLNTYGKVAFQTRTGSVAAELTSDASTMALWHLNEASGTDVADSSSGNNIATASGATIVDGLLNKARSFNGVSDYVAASDSGSLQLATSLTLEAWFKTLGDPNSVIVRKDSASGTRYLYSIMMDTTGQKVIGQYYNGTNFIVTSTVNIDDGNWHHAAVTIDGTTLTFYVDGVSQGTTTISGTQGVPNGELDIGAAPPFVGPTARSNYFAGTVDEVRISNTPRSASTIASDAVFWESWRPYTGGTSTSSAYLTMQTADVHTDWQSAYTLNVADGDVTRNVSMFEDESEFTAGNSTKLTTTGFQTDTGASLATSLISYWPMNETSTVVGTQVTRSDTYSTNHLTDNRTATSYILSGTGILGNAADLEFSNGNFFEKTDNAALSTGDIDFTIATWVKLESETAGSTWEIIMSKNDSSTVREYQLYYTGQTSDRIAFRLFDNDGTPGTAVCDVNANNFGAVTTGVWYHVVAWHDATANTCNIEINNGTANSSAESGVPGDTAANFRIGAMTTVEENFFDGLIDEVGFWKKVLSAQEITDLYNSGAANTYPSANQYAEATIATADISSYDYLTYWVRASQAGNTVKIGFGESAATENEQTVTIDAANTWQKVYYDISNIAGSSRDAVTKLRVTNLTSSANTIYVDNVKAEKLLTASSGSQITSTPGNYFQYRTVFTTSDTAYQPQLNNVTVLYNDGYKIVQADTNNARLYNYTGSTQQLRLDAVVFGADLAEWYTVDDQNIGAGDVVALTGEMDMNGVPVLRKAQGLNDPNLIGIISTKAGQTLGIEAENRRLLALAGRVPVKMDPTSPAIQPGDSITSSATPGFAKKAGFGDIAIAKAFQSWKPGQSDSLMVIVSNSTTRNTYLTSLEDYQLVRNLVDGTWNVIDQTTQGALESVGAFTNLLAANIKAGAIITSELVTEKFNAAVASIEQLTTKNLAVGLISPLSESTDVAIQIGSESTPSGQFVIQNASGSAVASIDNTGNATFSGTLYADQIKSKSLDEIQSLLTQVQTDQNFLKDAANWNIITATSSASLDQIAVADLYVTNQTAVNSLSVTNTVTVGSDLVFQSTMDPNSQLTDSSINTLSAPLKLQSLAMAPLDIMAGLVTIDTHGNVNIAGNLYIAGRIKSSGLTLSAIDNQESATGSALLTLENQTGTEVASVNASGSAQFGSVSTPQLVIAGADATQSGTIINGVITTNSTVGKATIPAGVSEITIKNPKVTDYTLVYVTPTSSTENNVLYVKSKEVGQFMVGFATPIDIDAGFNWWIVQVSQ
jgi:hypothetical protein